jgi:hypothetical protein
MSGIFNLIQFHLVPLGVALLIGVAAGWWMFRRPPAARQAPEDEAQP